MSRLRLVVTNGKVPFDNLVNNLTNDLFSNVTWELRGVKSVMGSTCFGEMIAFTLFDSPACMDACVSWFTLCIFFLPRVGTYNSRVCFLHGSNDAYIILLSCSLSFV